MAIILVFEPIQQCIPRITLTGGVKYTGVREICGFLSEIIPLKWYKTGP